MIAVMLVCIFLYISGIIVMQGYETLGHIMTIPLRMAIIIVPVYVYGPTFAAIVGGASIASLLTFEYEFAYKRLAPTLILMYLLFA